MSMKLTSPAFQNDTRIPSRLTGEGDDLSPALSWSGAPEHTVEFALIVDDPDAPGHDTPFVHWLLYSIPKDVHSLPEGVPPIEKLEPPLRGLQGRNSFLRIGYGGPMPPVGHGIHHYIFKLYALSSTLALTPGATKEELLRAMEGRVLDAAQLIGKYERQASQKTA